MPLQKKDGIKAAIDFISAKGVPAVSLPRGFILDTAFVKANDNFHITAFTLADPDDYIVAFNSIQAAKICSIMQERINLNHIKNGVDIPAVNGTYIDCNTKIGKGAVILPGSVITNSEIGENSAIGPCAHIRPGCKIGNNCKIGNFVEIKRSVIGDNTKVAHMTYIGDGAVGQNCNIGCGVIFCNYDGKEKHTATLGNNVFVGSDSCLISPVKIGDNAFIAAGSVITENVPDNALAIARARQAMKENYFSPTSPK
jgi:bifunctional UDP-N-acetylglucosamine pyrophosphorylase/glucosamine-1-phosphate N-acetyltransferase